MSAPSRREFLGILAAGAALLLPRPVRALGTRGRDGHPTPRPGITGEHVLTKDQLAESPRIVPLFDDIRAIPEVVDGIRCNCGCAGMPGFYSLLYCFEGNGMARACPVCQGQGRLVVRLHKAGKSLDEIRTAVDAQFG